MVSHQGVLIQHNPVRISVVLAGELGKVGIDSVLEDGYGLLVHLETDLVDFEGLIDVAVIVPKSSCEPVAN